MERRDFISKTALGSIVLAGGSTGSLCWFEEGTTDSRPKELTKVFPFAWDGS